MICFAIVTTALTRDWLQDVSAGSYRGSSSQRASNQDAAASRSSLTFATRLPRMVAI